MTATPPALAWVTDHNGRTTLAVKGGALPAEHEIVALFRRVVWAMGARDGANAAGDVTGAVRLDEIALAAERRMLELAETVAVVRGLRPATP